MSQPLKTSLHNAEQTWNDWVNANPHRGPLRINATTANSNLKEFHLEVLKQNAQKDPYTPKGTRIRLLRSATNTVLFDTCDFLNFDRAFHRAHAAIDEQFQLERLRNEAAKSAAGTPPK